MITGLIASNVYLINFALEENKKELVKFSRVIDGDTIELEDGRKIRLLNINAPEKNQPLSNLSTKFLESFQNKTIEMEIIGIGKYGRPLARLYYQKYINLELIKKGFVHKYIVEKDELSIFLKTEKQAREEERGIWEKSPSFGCIDVEINKKEEFLIIINKCNFNLQASIKDESTKTFEFKISGNEELRVFSGKGQNSESKIYLQSKRNIWNNDKDSIFIRDSNGFIIYHDSYGY